jgi:hypothetical protein
VAKIVDRCQEPVRAASAGCRASPGDRAPSRVVTQGAPRRRVPRRRHAACFVFKHLCSVLERPPLLHPTVSAALGRASPPAVPEGRGMALNGGIAAYSWKLARVGPSGEGPDLEGCPRLARHPATKVAAPVIITGEYAEASVDILCLS